MKSGRYHVAFTKDWNDVPTCTTHILKQVAKNETVIWIESIGTRKPNLAAGRDLGRIWSRAKRIFKKAEKKTELLRVLSPVLIPLATRKWELKVNQSLFRFYLWRESLLNRHTELVFWCFIPSAIDLIEPFSSKSKIVYYCVDDWPKFENLPTDYIEEREANTLVNADSIFATSLYLKNKCEDLSEKEVHYMPHGVPHRVFAKALKNANEQLPFQKSDRKVVGFYGTINDWIDFDLIEELVIQNTDLDFYLLGPVYTDAPNRFLKYPNVHFPGRIEYEDLYKWCSFFDVAIIPYDLENPRMVSVNPVKAREILSAGVPIVASNLKDLECLKPDVLIAESREDWNNFIREQIERKDRQEISKRRVNDDWEQTTQKILEKIG
ncbi:MAG: glycosyltransferase [Opitutales bacterium]|nr:glycosyltransferase [Opitutales bacterium]